MSTRLSCCTRQPRRKGNVDSSAPFPKRCGRVSRSRKRALHSSACFPPTHLCLMEAGERSGALPQALFPSRPASCAEHRAALESAWGARIPCCHPVRHHYHIHGSYRVCIPENRSALPRAPCDNYRSRRVCSSGSSAFLQRDYGLVLISIVVLIVCSIFIFRKEAVRIRFDRMAVRTPILGAFLRAYCLAGSFRTLSILLKSGTHLDMALAQVRRGIKNSEYKYGYARLEHTVLSGSSCSSGMSSFPRLFPRDIVHIIAAGERTGTLPESAGAVRGYGGDRAVRILESRVRAFGTIAHGADGIRSRIRRARNHLPGVRPDSESLNSLIPDICADSRCLNSCCASRFSAYSGVSLHTKESGAYQHEIARIDSKYMELLTETARGSALRHICGGASCIGPTPHGIRMLDGLATLFAGDSYDSRNIGQDWQVPYNGSSSTETIFNDDGSVR